MAQHHSQGDSHEHQVKPGQQSRKNTGKQASSSAEKRQNKSSSWDGTHEQPVTAGQQSHKNS